MDPLSITASVIAVLQLSAKVLGYLNDVKDASEDYKRFSIEAVNAHSLLMNLRFCLERGNADEPWYTAIRALGVQNGPLDDYKQTLEALQTKLIGKRQSRNVGRALVWKFKKEEIAVILDRLERLKLLISIALQMDHFELSRAIKEDLNFMRRQMPTIQSRVDNVLQDRADAKHRKLTEWISSTNYPAQQLDIIGRRQKETGQWFLDTAEFAKWINTPKGTLFCPGIPGAGKTMVAAIAIDHLLNHVQSSSVGVAYLYFNYKSKGEQNASNMVAAIVKQLTQHRPSLAEPIARLYEQHEKNNTKPALEKIFTALQEIATKYSTIYIVVDALDECQDSHGNRSLFLAKLRDLQARDVRLMITSRSIKEIEAEFKQEERLEIRASEEDVRRFVAGHMYRLPKCIQHDTALQKIVEDRISERVDGMFLLATLYMDSLLDKTSAKKIKTTLANLSTGSDALKDAYNGALERIKCQLDGQYDLAKKVLSWITYARRPLTTAELCCALAVEPGESALDLDNLPDLEDMLSVCAGLVVVDHESAVVRLVHYTTQEYFQDNIGIWNPDAALEIASTCVTYLSFDVFQTGSCPSNEEYEKRIQENDFLDYAAKHWGEHAAIVEEDEEEEELCALICSFLCNKKLVSSATQALQASKSRHGYRSQYFPKINTGLHLAARFGLSSVIENILANSGRRRETLLCSENSYGQSLLYTAAYNGHYRATELLLEEGVEVNPQGEYCYRALQAASSEGHEAIVELLLDHGASVNALDSEYSTAIQEASAKGHKAIVELLLRNGADVNGESGEWGDALQRAARSGHMAIVELLLEHGADVNAISGLWITALQAASSEGHEAIVELLLEKGADVNEKGDNVDTALEAASLGGHMAIVMLLLENDAEVNGGSGEFRSALAAASWKGHKAIVELLLEHGADINAPNGYHGSALQTASSKGHKAVVELLVKEGAEVNARGGYYGSPLTAASAVGHVAIAELLLRNGADMNVPSGRDGRDAIQEASAGGHKQIVELLLEYRAKHHEQNGVYTKPLIVGSARRS